MRALLLLPFLAACTGGNSLTGEDIGILRGGDSFTLGPQSADEQDDNGSTIPVSAELAEAGYQGGFIGGCLPEGTIVADPPMLAFGDAGSITVHHEGIETGIQPDWILHGVIDTDDGVITMFYEESNPEPSAETCTWALDYTIYGVPEGEWRIEARDDFALAEVTP